MVRGGGRGAGFKEAVLVPLLSKGGQGDQQQGGPGGKRVAHNGNSDICCLMYPYVAGKKTQIKVC
jgi:hypothetical protein